MTQLSEQLRYLRANNPEVAEILDVYGKISKTYQEAKHQRIQRNVVGTSTSSASEVCLNSISSSSASVKHSNTK